MKRVESLAVPGGSELPLLKVDGAARGPHVVILGGVHGDEYEGRAAAACIWHDVQPDHLRGTLSIVPTANAPACAAGTRVSPNDGLNLARTFPGRADGSITERIAHALTHLIESADLLIDLHSAGQHYAMPLLCGSFADESELGRRCEAAALAFDAPVFWAHPEVAPGRSLSAALAAGIPCIYAECGGGGRVRSSDLAAYRTGVSGVLAHVGALPPSGPPRGPRLRLRSSGDLDVAIAVTHAGILLESVRVLDVVRHGDALGRVVDDTGATLQQLVAPADGVVVMARRTARVAPGDGAYVLAMPDSQEDSQ